MSHLSADDLDGSYLASLLVSLDEAQASDNRLQAEKLIEKIYGRCDECIGSATGFKKEPHLRLVGE